MNCCHFGYGARTFRRLASIEFVQALVIICNSGSGKLLPVCAIAAVIVSTGASSAFDCVEKYCTKMSSCAEAHHHFTVCREQERDADNDGIPCENLCGKTLEEYRQRRGGAPSSVPETPSESLPLDPPAEPDPSQPSGPRQHDMTPADAPSLQCAGKRKCGDMDSCEEARFYLSKCGVRSLDRDGDGVPCESLCGGQ